MTVVWKESWPDNSASEAKQTRNPSDLGRDCNANNFHWLQWGDTHSPPNYPFL